VGNGEGVLGKEADGVGAVAVLDSVEAVPTDAAAFTEVVADARRRISATRFSSAARISAWDGGFP
jgi:hypothetical protein